MVRRIVSNSDFDSDVEELSEDIQGLKLPSGDGVAGNSGPLECPTAVESAPSSPIDTKLRRRRKVVRQRESESPASPTYEYDSDIYTEESSIGSFVVYTDDEYEDNSASGTARVD